MKQAEWNKKRRADVRAAFKDNSEQADYHAAVADERMQLRESYAADEAAKVSQPTGEQTVHDDPSATSALAKVREGKSFDLTSEERIAMKRLSQGGKIDPELAAVMGAAGLGAVVGAASDDDKGRGALSGAAAGLGLGALFAAHGGDVPSWFGQAGAVKGKGGMWHPEAVERLSEPLQDRLVGTVDAWPDGLHQSVKDKISWSDRAVRNYLNKHAGTESDPLKDVEIPFGYGTKRWEEVTDKALGARVKGQDADTVTVSAKEGETVWSLNYPKFGEVAKLALTNYLSHVGDYLRQNVDPAKLPQYDLVRAVKETAKWDKDLAAKMDKDRADMTQHMPVYKDYGDGYRWVEVKGKDRAQTEALLKDEGDQMGHCVGGYCDYVENGDSKIYSLRDAKGKSHVTVEVTHDKLTDVGRAKEARGEHVELLPPDIQQIKGKQNRAPDAKYLPYVQDFVKGGKWGEVEDLHNAGLVKGQRSGSFMTPEEARAKGEGFFGSDEPPEWGAQAGKADPRLLARLAAVGIGATTVAALSDEGHKKLGALLGAGMGFGLVHTGPKAIAESFTSLFKESDRIRITPLVEAHDYQMAAAARDTFKVQHKIEQLVPKAERRAAVTRALEGAKENLSPSEQAAVKHARQFFDTLGAAAQKAGVMGDLIENYVTHLWGKDEARTILADKKVAASMSPNTPFSKQRSIPTLEEGKAKGMVPLTEDISTIMGMYSNSVARAMANKQFLGALGKEKIPGTESPLVASADKAPRGMGYVQINHPMMYGKLVHPDIAPSLKAMFDSREAGVWTNLALGLNTLTKRAAVSFSLFHAKALHDAASGALGPVTATKIAAQSVAGKNPLLRQVHEGGAGDMVDMALKGGLKFSLDREATALPELTQGFYKSMQNIERGLDAAGPLGKVGAKGMRGFEALNHGFDKFMWQRLHAGLKLSTFATKFEQMTRANAEAHTADPKVPLKAPEEIAKIVASYTNDIYGGLNWTRLAEEAKTNWGYKLKSAAYSPSGRIAMQIALFAPDWTLSTTRAFVKSFDKGSGAKGILSPKEMGDLHRSYVARSMLYYFIVGDALNVALSDDHHHLWQNKDWTRIDVGNGLTMQWSKHTMEPFHWMKDPAQQAAGKLGFVPAEAINQAMGSEYIQTDPKKRGPWTDMDTSLMGRIEHAAKGVLPIAASSAHEAQSIRGASGMIGLPIYGHTPAEKSEMKAARRLEEYKKKHKAAETQ